MADRPQISSDEGLTASFGPSQGLGDAGDERGQRLDVALEDPDFHVAERSASRSASNETTRRARPTVLSTVRPYSMSGAKGDCGTGSGAGAVPVVVMGV